MSETAAPRERFPDPRPHTVVGSDGDVVVAGWRCSACRHALALAAPWCPVCRGELVNAHFGPGGVVWSSTVLRVPLPGRTPPYALAYVDLDDDGPRIIGHLAGDEARRLPIGCRVVLRPTSPDGDLLLGPEPTRGGDR
ncbi:MAG: OB-fold domain-containing protein [Aeromicrobium sp.]